MSNDYRIPPNGNPMTSRQDSRDSYHRTSQSHYDHYRPSTQNTSHLSSSMPSVNNVPYYPPTSQQFSNQETAAIQFTRNPVSSVPIQRPHPNAVMPGHLEQQMMNRLSIDNTHNTVANLYGDRELVPRTGVYDQMRHLSTRNNKPVTAPDPSATSATHSMYPTHPHSFAHGMDMDVNPARNNSRLTINKSSTTLSGPSSAQRSRGPPVAAGALNASTSSPFAPPNTSAPRAPRILRKQDMLGPYPFPNPSPCESCKKSHIRCVTVSQYPHHVCQRCLKRGLEACA